MDCDFGHGLWFWTWTVISDMDSDFGHGLWFRTWTVISDMDCDFGHGLWFHLHGLWFNLHGVWFWTWTVILGMDCDFRLGLSPLLPGHTLVHPLLYLFRSWTSSSWQTEIFFIKNVINYEKWKITRQSITTEFFWKQLFAYIFRSLGLCKSIMIW